MAYSYSLALKRFKSTVNPLKGVARASVTAVSRYSQHRTGLRDSALSSTVLLGFAAFEEYLKQCIEDIFDRAQANSLLVQRLPSPVRAYVSIAAHIDRWSEMDPARLLVQIESDRVAGRFMTLIDGSPISAAFSRLILERVKYPKPANLKTLFKRLGVGNVFAEMDAIAKANTSDLLTSFHDARTTLAHQGIPPGWNSNDFIKKLDELTLVAMALDRVMWGWTKNNLGLICWPSK